MAARTSLPALARSVGGVIDVQGTVVFRVPAVDSTFSAHATIDGTVFVQILQDGASPALHCIAVIDAPHLHDEELTESSDGVVTSTQLHWLGTAACVLAIVHGRIAHLVSLSAAILQSQTRHMPYDILGHLVAHDSILVMGTDASFGSVFATTADGSLVRFAERPSAPQRPKQADSATWRQVASFGTTPPHRHLAVSMHPDAQGQLLVATGSDSEASTAVWRMPVDASKHSSPVPAAEFLSVPCAFTTLQFRPTTVDAGSGGSSGRPATLLAAGTDGAIRVWLEVDAALALPPSFLAAAEANGKAVGRRMCLSQVLSPPALLPPRRPCTLATWATAGALPSTGPHTEHSSWIVATVYDCAPAGDDHEAAPDQVFIWSLATHAPDVPVLASATASTKANGKAHKRKQENTTTTESAVAAGCAVPCATGALWAHEAYRMDWVNRRKLAGAAEGGGMRLLQAASCSVREGSPVLAVAHVAVNASSHYAEIRPAVLDLVDVADTAITLPDGSALRAVAVHDVAPQQLAASHPNMQRLAAHPGMPVAASTGSSGRVAVWAVEPVELLCEVSPGGVPAAAVVWLEHPHGGGDGIRASTLVVCTRQHLLLYPFVPTRADAQPCAADLLHDHPARVPLPEAIPASETCTLHAVTGGARGSAAILLHCSAEGAGARAALFVVPDLSPEPLQAHHVLPCPAAAAQHAARAAHVSRIHGSQAWLAVTPAMPPAVSVLAAEEDRLETVWTSATTGPSKGVVANAGHVLGAHASVPCATAAVLCDFPGLPRKLSLWSVVASGGHISLVPEQMVSVADAAGDVHVMAVGLGRAAVAVAGSRSITLWLRCSVGWAAAVRTAVPGTAHTLAATPFGILAGLPMQLLLFEPTVNTPRGCVAIGGAAGAAAPPQPLWHPGTLLLLLLQGLHGSAAGLLRLALSHGLQQGDVPAVLKQVSKGVLPLPTLSAAMLALAGHSFPVAPTRPERRPQGARALRGSAPAGGAVAGARNRVTGLPSRPTSGSGLLDTSAFSFGARPAAPPSSTQDAASSGMLDLAAFGMGGFTAAPAGPSPLQPGPPQPQSILSPLAAPVMSPQPLGPGRCGASGAVATPLPQQTLESPAVGQAPASDPVSSGQVDLLAFGIATPKPQPTLPSPAAVQDAMETGQVDLAAFGNAQPQPPADDSPTPELNASGQIDVARSSARLPPPGPPATPASADNPAALQVASGRVDLAQFGMGPQVPEPAGAASASAPAVTPADPMASGQIDPAQFGMGPPAALAIGAALPLPEQATRPAPCGKPPRPPAAPSSLEPMITGMLDPAAFDTSATPAAAAPTHDSVDACTPSSLQRDGARQPLGESDIGSSGVLDRAPSFEMHFPGTLLPSAGADSLLRSAPALTPRLGRPAGAVGEAVAAHQPNAQPSAVLRTLQALQQLEAHCPAAAEQLSEQELEELRAAVLPQRGVQGVAGGAPHRISSRPEAHALLRLAELVAFSGSSMTTAAQVHGLDVAGRRVVSAARTGSALLKAQWDAAASEADALVAEVDMQRSRRKPKMSLSQSALLAKLKGGSVATGGDSHMSHSAALSSVDITHHDPVPGLGTEAVDEAAAEACTEAWSRLHVLPTLHGAALHWAFDCASPRALLEAAMSQMPMQERDQEHDNPETSGMETFFAVAASPGPQSPWTWANFRRIGAALWLQEEADVTHAAEKIAKATFAARKDPYEVAMWYCAQGRRSLLAGMLRSKGDTRVADFLGRNFEQQQNRAAAAKNAHKLLSQHRYSLATSFFLLAHDVPAALATCLEHLHDVQLAIMLARVVEAAGTIPWAPGSHGFCADLFAQLIADDAAAECPVLHGLLRRATGERYTIDAAEVHAIGCERRGIESQMTRLTAGAGPLGRAIGACGAVQATDWLMRAVLSNLSPQHANSVPEVAAVPAAAIQQALGNMAAHAAQACEHVGNPTAAMLLEIRSLATYGGKDLDGKGGHGCLAAELRLVSLARISGLHAQCTQSCISGTCMKGAPDWAVDGSLLFADEAPLLAQVQASRPIAAAAVAWFAAGHQEELLQGVYGVDGAELLQLQGADLAPAQTELEHSVSRAVGLATVVQEQPSAEAVAHRQSVAAQRALEEAGARDDGPLRAESSYSILTVGEKDAQAVQVCRGSLLPPGSHPQVAVATKKRGLVFCTTQPQQPSMSARSLRFSQLHERVVERWAGTPGPVTGTQGQGMCHPVANAKYSHRVQMVHPRPEGCVAQALASHPQQATLLSGAAPGYLHAWRFTDSTLKATYAPLPFSHHMTDNASTSVPQPSQVVNWSYAMSIAYNDSGSRFAAIGKGGWVAMWRHDAQWANTAHGRVGCCDWAHQCVDRRGAAVSFVGARSTLLLTAGTNTEHQDITLWDVTAPLNSARVGNVHTAHHVADARVCRDGSTVVAVDRHGDVCAYDLRKLTHSLQCRGASIGNGAMIWRSERAHGSGATCIALCPGHVWQNNSISAGELAATGGRDGNVILWDVSTGVAVQTLHKVHSTANRGLFGFSTSEERAPSKVKSLSFNIDGLVSIGHNDSVMVTPWRALLE